jgi:hypothetical protein
LFVLRAVMKAAPLLTSYDYNTGLPEEDAHTRQLITQLVSCVAAAAAAVACVASMLLKLPRGSQPGYTGVAFLLQLVAAFVQLVYTTVFHLFHVAAP